MESCVRKIHFCYGHRVMNHESKCANLHGHNGVVWVHATPIQGQDSIGRIIDFSVIKEKVGGWIDAHWDHTLILHRADVDVIAAAQGPWQNKPIFLLPGNPTAENMAKYLLNDVCPLVLKGHGVIVHKIVFWETENSFVEECLDPRDPRSVQRYI